MHILHLFITGIRGAFHRFQHCIKIIIQVLIRFVLHVPIQRYQSVWCGTGNNKQS